MRDFLSIENIPRVIAWFQRLFLIVFPFQTIWIVQERFIGGSKWEYGTQGFFASEILLWLIVFLFIVRYAMRMKRMKESRPRFSEIWQSPDRRLALSALLIVLFSLGAVLWSGDAGLARQAARYTIEATLVFFLFLAGPLSIIETLNWFLMSAAMQSGIAIFQFLFQSSPGIALFGMSAHTPDMAGASIVASDRIGRILRGYGTFPHPNMLGGFLALTLTMFFIAAHRLAVRSWLTVCIVSLLFAGLFVSFSRGAWIAMLLSLLSFVFLLERKKPKAACYPSAVLIGLSLFVFLVLTHIPVVSTRFSASSPHEDVSTEERINGVRTAAGLFAAHPFFGFGPGQYTVALAQRFPELSGWQLQPVHASGILLLVERGIIGLFFVIFFLFSFWRFLRSSAKKDESRGLSSSLIIALIAVIVLGAFDHYLISHLAGLYMAALFFACIGRLYSPQSIHSLST